MRIKRKRKREEDERTKLHRFVSNVVGKTGGGYTPTYLNYTQQTHPHTQTDTLEIQNETILETIIYIHVHGIT